MPNNHKNHRKRRRWLLLGVIALALAGGVFGIAAALRPNHQIDPSKLASVERGDIARSVVATGKITPLAKVEVKSKASGLVNGITGASGRRSNVRTSPAWVASTADREVASCSGRAAKMRRSRVRWKPTRS